MRIRLTFDDNESFTAEEAKAVNRNIHGSNSEIEILPDSDFPEAHIRYGIQEIIIPELIDLYYAHEDAIYKEKIDKIKGNTLSLVNDIIDKIVLDTENKLLEE